MSKVSDQQLIECLDLMEQGMSVTDILARYPNQSDTLRPFLETAAQLSQLATNPTIAQQNKSQEIFLAQVTAMKTAPVETISVWLWLRRLLLPAVALSVLLILFAGGLFTASAAALPGDGLYSIKRQFEGLQLQLVPAPADKLRLIEQFSAERRREVAALLLSGRTEEAAFDGRIEAMTTDRWVVSAIPVEISEQTLIAGTPQIGAVVRVTGLADNDRFTATTIEILTFEPTDPELLPTTTPTETVSPTATVSPSPTNALTATETAVPTITAEPTDTPLPTATSTPKAIETETAVPSATSEVSPPTTTPDDDNDNDNDNEDDNNNGGDDDNENGEEDNDNGEDNGNDNSEDNENEEEDNANSEDNDNEEENNENSGDNENYNDDDNKNEND